jgi:hypothetical protein
MEPLSAFAGYTKGKLEGMSRMVSSGLLRRVARVRTTRRNNPEDTILHSHRRENLKSYIEGMSFTMVGVPAENRIHL